MALPLRKLFLACSQKKAKQAVNIDHSASIQRRMLYAHRIKGEASEAVATGLVRDAIEYAGRTAAVDEYLTD
jgi:RNA 3'-terminal phosphate cyclase